jgi:AraC-like DNA-binding protein
VLSGYPLVHTTSIEEAEELASRLNAPVRAEPTTRRESFGWRANRVAVGNLGIVASSWGGSVRASSPNTGPLYSLLMPLQGGAVFKANGIRTAAASGRSAIILSPDISLESDLGSGYGGVQVGMAAATVASAFRVLTGEDSKRPVRFSPSIDLTQSTPSFLRTLEFIIGEAERSPRVVASPLVAARLSEAFIYALLLEGVHDHRALLDRQVRSAEPPQIRRVEEYIRAHLAEPLTLAALVSVAGVSARALQAGFRAHRGVTPMAFLRDCRLELVRARLLASSGVTIRQVATECGFEHMGRFNVAYRARFGESPRTTLARRR